MNSLPIPPGLLVENGVLVLRQHLLLRWHLSLPSLQSLRRKRLLRQRGVERRDDGVDVLEALAVTELLWAGEAPGDFPADVLGMLLGVTVCWGERTRAGRRIMEK